MAKRQQRPSLGTIPESSQLGASTDDLRLAALDSGDPSKTGRYLVTFKEDATTAAVKHLKSKRGMRLAHARDFENQAVAFEKVGDADGLVFPEIGAALLSGPAAIEHDLLNLTSSSGDTPLHSVDPEYFMFANALSAEDYLTGVMHAAQMIARDLGVQIDTGAGAVKPEAATKAVARATWGLNACQVPSSNRTGKGIRVAVLDTGLDLKHPDFVGRTITSCTFVGQPVQDLHGHGTHTAGTACGPRVPAGHVPRYGIAFSAHLFIGKVLTNSGGGTQAQVLAGMNWAIANRCHVISVSLGAPISAQPAYTAAGNAALKRGCLIIAASGNSGVTVSAPANSPSIVSVGAVDNHLNPAPFSNIGKVDIAGPGVSILSSWPRPKLHNTIGGTSMATPHVSGCAALWAQTSKALRGAALRARLAATAKHLTFPHEYVGAGLVRAPK